MAGMPYPPNLCASVQSVGVFVGGYGIPAIPTPPSEFLPQNHSKFVCASPPTEFTEFTEVSGGGYSPTDFTEYTEASGGEEPPTDFTDAHRWLGYVGFSHEIHSKFAEECDAVA